MTPSSTPSTSSCTSIGRIRATYLLHSPGLSDQRKDTVRMIESMMPNVSRIITDEPTDIVKDLKNLCDIDKAKILDDEFKARSQPLHIRNVSIAIKHYRALSLAASSLQDDEDFALILEDDALFGSTVVDALALASSNAPSDTGVVFMGLPSPRQPSSANSMIFVDVKREFGGVLPACESYLVTKKAAQKLVSAFLPVRFAMNVHFSFLMKMTNTTAYLTAPNIFLDGSKLGLYPGTVGDISLPWNQPYCKMEALVKGPVPGGREYGEKEDDAFRSILSEQSFKGHPAVLALVAKHLVRSRKYQDADRVYAAALDMMERCGCVVNSQSSVLKDAIALHKHLQPTFS